MIDDEAMTVHKTNSQHLGRRAWKWLAALVLLAIAMSACGSNEAIDLPASEAINIRIQNNTGDEIGRFTLGRVAFDSTGTFETVYVDIPDGEASIYQPVDPSTSGNYSIIRISGNDVSDDTRILFNPENIEFQQSFDATELEVGSFYTFTIVIDTVIDDVESFLLVNVTEDDAPAIN